jgi:anti-sigma B factor antagonist
MDEKGTHPMALPQATMIVRHVTPTTSVIDIRGDINAFAENALMDAYTEAAAPDVHNFILNFSGLEFMNSGGIGLLITLLIRINRQQQRLLAFGLSDHYRRIFELTRLTEAISIYETEADAIAASGN